jgi:ubiquinone/menaquinone biosynthesis C-methylase UbiE
VTDPTNASSAGIDRTVLREHAYADEAKLDDRRNLYVYREPAFDLVERVLDRLDVPPSGRVLDVGCGPGTYLAALQRRDESLRVTGADLSLGMLRSASRAGVEAVVSVDATALPFGSSSFDTAMANHMLYHVDPIDAAVAELRRVVRSDGHVLVVTNSVSHFAEFDALLAAVSGRDGWWRPSHRFTLANGRVHLASAFETIELVRFDGELRVPDAEPVVRFARSMRDLSGHGFDDDEWERLMADFGNAVDQAIRRDGVFRTRTDSGVFVCR